MYEVSEDDIGWQPTGTGQSELWEPDEDIRSATEVPVAEKDLSAVGGNGPRTVDTSDVLTTDHRTGYGLPEPDDGFRDEPPDEPRGPANWKPLPTAPAAPSEPTASRTRFPDNSKTFSEPPRFGGARTQPVEAPTPETRPERVERPDPANVERAERYGELARRTLEVVRNLDVNDFEPEARPVVRVLGSVLRSTQFAQVVDGVAELSPAQQTRNGPAIVQLLPGETAVRIGSSIAAAPTPDRLHRTADRYWASERDLAERFERARENWERRPDYDEGTTVRLDNKRAATTDNFFFSRHPATEEPMHMQARSAIVLRDDADSRILVHEIVHEVDNNTGWRRSPQIDPERELAWRAWKEFRAHHVAAVCSRGTDWSQQRVEDIRLNNPASRPFEPTPARIRELQAINALPTLDEILRMGTR